ncbi:hypothetical protein HDU96_001024, partial [Phlyctochytrium bullatum]
MFLHLENAGCVLAPPPPIQRIRPPRPLPVPPTSATSTTSSSICGSSTPHTTYRSQVVSPPETRKPVIAAAIAPKYDHPATPMPPPRRRKHQSTPSTATPQQTETKEPKDVPVPPAQGQGLRRSFSTLNIAALEIHETSGPARCRQGSQSPSCTSQGDKGAKDVLHAAASTNPNDDRETSTPRTTTLPQSPAAPTSTTNSTPTPTNANIHPYLQLLSHSHSHALLTGTQKPRRPRHPAPPRPRLLGTLRIDTEAHPYASNLLTCLAPGYWRSTGCERQGPRMIREFRNAERAYRRVVGEVRRWGEERERVGRLTAVERVWEKARGVVRGWKPRPGPPPPRKRMEAVSPDRPVGRRETIVGKIGAWLGARAHEMATRSGPREDSKKAPGPVRGDLTEFAHRSVFGSCGGAGRGRGTDQATG